MAGEVFNSVSASKSSMDGTLLAEFLFWEGTVAVSFEVRLEVAAIGLTGCGLGAIFVRLTVNELVVNGAI